MRMEGRGRLTVKDDMEKTEYCYCEEIIARKKRGYELSLRVMYQPGVRRTALVV
jgi:hypothetical protein